MEEGLFETDFTDNLLNLLDQCYTKGARHDDSFGKLLSRLFSKHGLLLAGSNCKPVKQNVREGMKLAISKANEIRTALESQSSELEQQFHQQATIYDSNLFFLDEEAGRTKIYQNGSRWKTDSGESWSTDELLDLIDEMPHKFSPNVFLRPILQDLLVPTLGYVAGPGELAYYGQMKKMYELFDCKMPAIIPRMSGTIIEPAIDRVLAELPFEIGDYKDRIEDLESSYVDQTEQHDIEAIFGEWKETVKQVSEKQKEVIKEIDPTLEGAAGKATAVYFGELDKLKGKVYRSVKQQDETQLKRHKLKPIFSRIACPRSGSSRSSTL
ncbi:MAG: bacillithiol biosynthesis BshC [Balneolaceae bacterium]|nr:bacillithiol biosynthesis BshC [Balneolaceae bacterium]